MKITFVIPAYNIEDYIRQCIDSMLAVRFVNKEIILVLGCSSDKTNFICRESQRNHPEIIIIHQDGTGLSNARNCGLVCATGDYIIFVDGDDYFRHESLEECLSLLKNANVELDIVVSDFISIVKNDKIASISQQISLCSNLKTGTGSTKLFLSSKGSIWNVWRYIYRIEFLKRENLHFLDNTKCEDVLFTIQAFLKAKMIAYLHNPYYCYRVRRNGALTTQIDHSFICDFLTILQKSVEEIKNSKNDTACFLYEKVQREYVLNLANLRDVKKKDRLSAYADYENSSWIIKNSNVPVLRLVYTLIKYGGVKMVSIFLHEVRQIRRNRFWHILKIF